MGTLDEFWWTQGACVHLCVCGICITQWYLKAGKNISMIPILGVSWSPILFSLNENGFFKRSKVDFFQGRIVVVWFDILRRLTGPGDCLATNMSFFLGYIVLPYKGLELETSEGHTEISCHLTFCYSSPSSCPTGSCVGLPSSKRSWCVRGTLSSSLLTKAPIPASLNLNILIKVLHRQIKVTIN